MKSRRKNLGDLKVSTTLLDSVERYTAQWLLASDNALKFYGLNARCDWDRVSHDMPQAANWKIEQLRFAASDVD